MECLNEKIKNLYLELCYVRIEWSLFKEINSKDDVEHIYVQNEEMFLSMKDSLLYSIIMRVAKICENDTEVNSIYKVFNCCSSSSIFSKIISKSEIDLLKNNLEEKIIIEKEGKKINLIKKWRDKYFAHYSKLISTLELQKEFAISKILSFSSYCILATYIKLGFPNPCLFSSIKFTSDSCLNAFVTVFSDNPNFS